MDFQADGNEPHYEWGIPEYLLFDMPIHLACSHAAHWTLRWLVLTGTLHGNLQFLGPVLTSTSPASRSRVRDRRDRLVLRCENFVAEAVSQRWTFRLTGANLTTNGGSPG